MLSYVRSIHQGVDTSRLGLGCLGTIGLARAACAPRSPHRARRRCRAPCRAGHGRLLLRFCPSCRADVSFPTYILNRELQDLFLATGEGGVDIMLFTWLRNHQPRISFVVRDV